MSRVTYSAGVTSHRSPEDVAVAPRVAGGVSLLEALALFLAAARYVLELTAGEATDASLASMSMVVCLVFGVLLVVLGMSWLRGRAWPRTPTIVWNLLLLPAAWTLATTSGAVAGVALALVALVGIGPAIASPASNLPDTTL